MYCENINKLIFNPIIFWALVTEYLSNEPSNSVEEIYLKIRSLPNSENLSTNLKEKENNCIIE